MNIPACVESQECSLGVVSIRYDNGSFHFINQCSVCGRLDKRPISKAKVANPGEVLPYNVEKLRAFEGYVEFIEQRGKERWADYVKTLRLHQENRAQAFQALFNLPYTDFDSAYALYIKSEFWKTRRAAILKRDNYKCRVCEIQDANQVHHVSYRNLCCESDLELIAVCEACHAKVHGILPGVERADQLSPIFMPWEGKSE